MGFFVFLRGKSLWQVEIQIYFSFGTLGKLLPIVFEIWAGQEMINSCPTGQSVRVMLAKNALASGDLENLRADYST